MINKYFFGNYLNMFFTFFNCLYVFAQIGSHFSKLSFTKKQLGIEYVLQALRTVFFDNKYKSIFLPSLLIFLKIFVAKNFVDPSQLFSFLFSFLSIQMNFYCVKNSIIFSKTFVSSTVSILTEQFSNFKIIRKLGVAKII